MLPRGETRVPATAVAQMRRCEPAVVTMDLGLPPHPDDPSEGLLLLEEINAFAPDTKVIVLTGSPPASPYQPQIPLMSHCPGSTSPAVTPLSTGPAARCRGSAGRLA